MAENEAKNCRRPKGQAGGEAGRRPRQGDPMACRNRGQRGRAVGMGCCWGARPSQPGAREAAADQSTAARLEVHRGDLGRSQHGSRVPAC